MAQSLPDGWRRYQDPQGRFQFFYPEGFGTPSRGTDDGFRGRTASIRFPAFGGEAVLTTGPPQVDLQSAGGLYDAIALQALTAAMATTIRDVLPVLTAASFCDAIGREQHFDPVNARFSGWTAAQKRAAEGVDRMGNIAPRILQCEISGDTVTFHKEAAFDPARPRRHIYGAIRFLPPPYSSFQLIRGGADAPTIELLAQVTEVVTSWKEK